MKTHEDWYDDGEENGEDMWRLDFSFGRHAMQAQVFLVVLPRRDGDTDPPTSSYAEEGRLFLERDNREELNLGTFIDYACDEVPISLEQAKALIEGSKDNFIEKQLELINKVVSLPNQNGQPAKPIDNRLLFPVFDWHMHETHGVVFTTDPVRGRKVDELAFVPRMPRKPGLCLDITHFLSLAANAYIETPEGRRQWLIVQAKLDLEPTTEKTGEPV